MDDVDELDLDDDFFSSAQPIGGIPWKVNTATNLSSASRPSVALHPLRQTSRGEQQTPTAASKGSNASHRVPLKPLATMLQTPNFPRGARPFTPPMQPLCSEPAQLTHTGLAYTQNGSFRATKRPAEGQSLLSSKRVVVERGHEAAVSLRSQPPSSTPTACSQLGLAQSGFRQPSAPVHQGPRLDRQGPTQLHSRTVTPIGREEPSHLELPSSALSGEQRAVSTTFLIPGPAGMLQQQMGQATPAASTLGSSRSQQQSFPSPQDDFSTEAWRSAMGAANALGCAGELSCRASSNHFITSVM